MLHARNAAARNRPPAPPTEAARRFLTMPKLFMDRADGLVRNGKLTLVEVEAFVKTIDPLFSPWLAANRHKVGSPRCLWPRPALPAPLALALAAAVPPATPANAAHPPSRTSRRPTVTRAATSPWTSWPTCSASSKSSGA